MSDLNTARLRLHPLTAAEGRRVLDAAAAEGDRWAADFPMQDDRDGVDGFVKAAEAGVDRGPFGCYRVDDPDGVAIGTIGFYGPPDEDGQVTIGYGLVPDARGSGYASEAVGSFVELCRSHPEVRAMLADTESGNVASQRVLEKNGFVFVREDASQFYYRLDVAAA